MLKSLYISNYALISELHIDFEAGFSVLTGETGAGKSIILGALSLILGQRADNKFIKSDADKCIIEAEFNIANYQQLTSIFTDNDLDFDDVCIIRRELTSAGKSRAFVNDTPVSLTVIRDLSNQLIDIHSQHENLLLSNNSYQLGVVDTIADNSIQYQSYTELFGQWQLLKSELRKLKHAADTQASDLDYLQFQFKQLYEANLIADEQLELESEQETLSHIEEIKLELQRASHLLDDEHAVLQMLKECLNSMSKVQHFIPDGQSWYERIQSSHIDLKDVFVSMNAYEERLEYNPTRLEWVQNRLSELFTLQRKYKVESVAELILLRDEFSRKLSRIDSYDDELKALQNSIDAVYADMLIASQELTQSRKLAAVPIERYLVEQLTKLGMPNIQFQVSFSVLSDFLENGVDEVQFLFSANKNRAMQPVAQIASGGEVSRLMLSIKSLVANKSDLPTIIFDEIDTGVSGEIAHRMGDIMKAMSADMQVITITHLPQIAAKGMHQYRVYKDDSGAQTQTHIKQLQPAERIDEIAQMLSGKQVTDAALLNAREMLSNA